VAPDAPLEIHDEFAPLGLCARLDEEDVSLFEARRRLPHAEHRTLKRSPALDKFHQETLLAGLVALPSNRLFGGLLTKT
jgi:hypothetical protein